MVSMSESVSPDDRKALDIVVKETDHLNEWISELLDYARPSKGGTTEFDLAESIVHSVHFVRNLPGAESIEIETNLQPGITLKGDPQRFSRIVLNIAKNAIEAMDGKGLIVVRSYKVIKGDSYEVIVDITNDGPPIPTEELERIFEAFYTTKARGTGLGLTTVIQICEDFNATLDVVSSESQGTVFTVHIPV
jgi:two-component system sensor histidine kinase PilS (NtrC family)